MRVRERAGQALFSTALRGRIVRMFESASDAPFGGSDVASLGDRELAARVVELERDRAALDAEHAVALAELEVRTVCEVDFQLPVGAWLAREGRLPAAVANT